MIYGVFSSGCAGLDGFYYFFDFLDGQQFLSIVDQKCDFGNTKSAVIVHESLGKEICTLTDKINSTESFDAQIVRIHLENSTSLSIPLYAIIGTAIKGTNCGGRIFTAINIAEEIPN